MKCPKCQFENPADTHYCGRCGTRLVASKQISFSQAETLETTTDELTRGSTFAGRYEIIEKLGEGGLGRVYRIFDTRIKEEVALKLLRPEITSDKKTIERFNNELKFARKIAHKNVCRMYDLGEEGKTHYIAMEYVPGENLKSMIRMMGQLSPAQAVSIAKQVCEGLREAHSLGVVHRDIKSGNIMIGSHDGNARIMDFGIARSLKAKGITGVDVIVGTPEYMSPEQLEGKEADQCSDLYSLGVTLFEMVTGRLPFEGETSLSVAIKHKTEPPPDPKKYNTQVPEALSQVILKCMEKDRDKRYKTVRELYDDLSEIEEQISVIKESAPKGKAITLKKEGLRFRKWWVVVVTFLVVVIGVSIGILLTRKESAPSVPGEKMLVVLPFENLGSSEDEYFADGLTDELTSRLSVLYGLGVISRSSATQYKNTRKTIKQIGEELGVDYMLEGSVRWDRSQESRGRVRVTPQLIRVSDNTHLWSENYDRIIEDIFSVQSDIAEQVVKQLDLAILEPERKALLTKPTDNFKAFDYYLRAGEQLYKGGSSLDPQEFEQAVELYEKAIDLDPDFTLAYVSLSFAHLTAYTIGIDRTPERLAKSRDATDKALELEPNFPSAKSALAFYYYWGFQDYERALEIFESIQRAWPNFTSAYVGYILRRQGRWEESIANVEKAFKLNPLSDSIAIQQGSSLLAMRRYEEAEDWFDRAVSVAQNPDNARLGKVDVAILSEANTQKARALLERLPHNRMTDHNWFTLFMLERKFQDALDHLASLSYDSYYWAGFYFHKNLFYASVYQAKKDFSIMKMYGEKARLVIEEILKKNPGDPGLHAALGLAYAYQGQKEEAIREGNRAVELYPESRDAVEGRYYVLNLTQIYTIVGEYDEAINKLEYLLSIPSGDLISVPLLRIDPTWDPLREHPRFRRLVEENSEKEQRDYPVKPLSFTEVQIDDDFWLPRMETNRTVTIPFAFKKCEETGRIDNFAKAGGLMPGKFVGIRYNDSDVFKIMEGAAYSLALHPDPELEKYMDDLIEKIAAAQEDDGYLYTARTIESQNLPPGTGEERWSNLGSSHELYNVGHMYEAAVAYYLATGKRSFLDIAKKNADFIASVFGPDKRQGFPGHQEIEIGLVKLYRVTGEGKYLKLAKFFLDERGRIRHEKKFAETSAFSIYNQDWYLQAHKPVAEQDEAVGHAVRATYMYSGMADVAALTGNVEYLNALDQLWKNVVSKKIYITGGIGSRHEGEAFGENYELPNATAYNETCAAIGNVFWNYRLFLLNGDAKYIDVLERTLYNGLLAGISLSGDLFFYPNPLESDGKFPFNQGEATRKPWFDCACCPVNVARFVPSIPGYVFAQQGDILYINLFVQGKGKIQLGENVVYVTQETRYPWEGKVKISIEPEKPAEFSVYIRIPGWARNEPIPSDLYSCLSPVKEKPALRVNSETWELNMEKGFARIQRKWQKGDVIELDLPMPVQRVVAHEAVRDDVGKIALQRGPLVYCLEGVDNGGEVLHRTIADDLEFDVEFNADLLGGINVLKSRNQESEESLVAIPYYVWSHRGVGEMAVWLPRE